MVSALERRIKSAKALADARSRINIQRGAVFLRQVRHGNTIRMQMVLDVCESGRPRDDLHGSRQYKLIAADGLIWLGTFLRRDLRLCIWFHFENDHCLVIKCTYSRRVLGDSAEDCRHEFFSRLLAIKSHKLFNAMPS